MKYLSCIALILLLYTAFSCKKTSFIESNNARLSVSEDTLHFDTVFTTLGSVTQSLKIFNNNDQKLRLSQIQLAGAGASFFKINVDGSPGYSFSDIELEPNDSLYVFVSVTINPGVATNPFVVRDSLRITYNGNEQIVQLEAYGQNAHFMRNKRVTTDSTWTGDLPYVIVEKLTVDSNVSLTLQKGCRIYSHADAPFIVNGSLKVLGKASAADRVTFTGDRIDPDYAGLPGGWPGIFFTVNSRNNVLNYAIIRDAYQGIISQAAVSNTPAIIMNQCILFNITDAGILAKGTDIAATNCLIANCGANINITGGGTYAFDQCTLASYGNFLVPHQNPVLFLSNTDTLGNASRLSARFRNCIIYGNGGQIDNEIVTFKKGNPARRLPGRVRKCFIQQRH